MPKTAILLGFLLILIGVVGYVYGMNAGNASPTALIPAAFGFIIMDCGILSMIKEGWRKHLMHVAVALALVGFIMVAARVLMKISTFAISAASVSQLSMAAVCLIFVVLGIRSFSAARRNG